MRLGTRIVVGLITVALAELASSAAGAAMLYVGDTVTATGTGGGQSYTVTTDGNPSNGTVSPTSTFVLGNSFNETISGITYPTTGANFNLYPAYPLGANGTGSPWNFQDDYYFALNPGATIQAAVVSNSMSNIQDLQVRLIYAAGNTVSSSHPVLGPPAGGTLLNAWQTLNLGGGSINLTMPATVSPSNYILQIRGEVEPNTQGQGLPGSYGGSISFTPVPLPPALPLLLLGLGLGVGLFRSRSSSAAALAA